MLVYGLKFILSKCQATSRFIPATQRKFKKIMLYVSYLHISHLVRNETREGFFLFRIAISIKKLSTYV